MTPVEFRYYQCLLNPTTGDRVTVGLLFWDGARLRWAHSPSVSLLLPKDQRDLVRRALHAIEERVRMANEQGPRPGAPLQDVFRVREGVSSSLFWSEQRGALTPQPDAFFAELCSLLHFTPAAARPVRLSTKKVFQELRKLGEELAREAPERVKVDTEIGTHHHHRSPVSWKNGRWHHTVPLSFAAAESRDQLHDATEKVIGRVQTAFQNGDVPVIVAVLPEDPELLEAAEQEAELLRSTLQGGHAVVIADHERDYLKRLQQTVLHDIQS